MCRALPPDRGGPAESGAPYYLNSLARPGLPNIRPGMYSRRPSITGRPLRRAVSTRRRPLGAVGFVARLDPVFLETCGILPLTAEVGGMRTLRLRVPEPPAPPSRAGAERCRSYGKCRWQTLEGESSYADTSHVRWDGAGLPVPPGSGTQSASRRGAHSVSHGPFAARNSAARKPMAMPALMARKL